MICCRSSVRVVKSLRPGVGKSFYVKNMITKLRQSRKDLGSDSSKHVTVPINGKHIKTDEIFDILNKQLPTLSGGQNGRIIHIDVSNEV